MKQNSHILFVVSFMILVFGVSASKPITSPNTPLHCYALLSPVDVKTEDSSHIIESACFDTFSEAIDAATKGRVHLDPSTHPGDVTDEDVNYPESIDSSAIQVVIGIDWDGTDYGGSSYTWVVDDSGCTDTTQFSVSSMPFGWNDRVSSSKAFSNCNYYYHYQNSNFGGSSVVCSTDCPNMGSLDNATSSEKWKKNP